MKQTKQSMLMGLVLTVMMLVGANTAFGQAAITSYDAAGALSYSNATCDATTLTAAITAAGNDGKVVFTGNCTIDPNTAAPTTISVPVITASTPRSITFTGSAAGTKLVLTNSDATNATDYTTLSIPAFVTLNLGDADNRLDIELGAKGVLTTATHASAPGTINLTGKGNVIFMNAATATLTNHGVVSGSSDVPYSTTTDAEFWDNATPATTNIAPGVFFKNGAITATTTGVFGNLFIEKAVTLTASVTYRIADGSTVGILNDITHDVGFAYTFRSPASATAKGTFTVRHHKGVISGGDNTSAFVVNGNLFVGGKATTAITAQTVTWDNSTTLVPITVLGDVTFGQAAATGLSALTSSYNTGAITFTVGGNFTAIGNNFGDGDADHSDDTDVSSPTLNVGGDVNIVNTTLTTAPSTTYVSFTPALTMTGTGTTSTFRGAVANLTVAEGKTVTVTHASTTSAVAVGTSTSATTTATLNVNANLTSTTVTVNRNDILAVGVGATLAGTNFTSNRGAFTNDGTGTFSGTFTNSGGTFTNNGSTTVTSTFGNNKLDTSAGTPVVESSQEAVTTNTGTLILNGNVTNASSTFANSGTVTLGVGISFTNTNVFTLVNGTAALQTPALVTNSGTANMATFTNTRGDVTNSGDFIATTSFTNTRGTFTNEGEFITATYTNGAGDSEDATVLTKGTTVNSAAGVFKTNTLTKTNGTFTNNGTLSATTASGQLNVTLARGTTFTNTGTATFADLDLTSASATTKPSTTVTNSGTLTIAHASVDPTVTVPVRTVVATTAGTTTVTQTAAFTNSGTFSVSGGTLNLNGTISNAGTFTRTGGTFNVNGPFTNDATGAISAATAFTAARAAAVSGTYVTDVVTAATTDGIVVYGNFTNNNTAAYAGNVIVTTSARTLPTIAAASRTVTVGGAFGTLTTVGVAGSFNVSLSANATVNNLVVASGDLDASAATTVTLTGSTSAANGVPVRGVVTGANARWSDNITVTVTGVSTNRVALGQATPGLTNGPLTVTSGQVQLTSNARVLTLNLAAGYSTIKRQLGTNCFTFSVAGTTTGTGTILSCSLANVQVIHNAPAGSVDVLFNNALLLDDFAYQTATGFLPVEDGVATNVDVKTADGTTTLLSISGANFEANKNYIFLVQGGADGKTLEVKVVDYARVASTSNDGLQTIFSHGVTNGPAVNLERVTTSTPRTLEQLLAVNAAYGSVTSYMTQLNPGISTLQLKASGTVVGQYLFDFGNYAGKTLTLVATGRVGGTGANALMLVGYDVNGNKVTPQVTTSDEDVVGPTTQLPTEFTVYGNYPNPFNPTTNVRFDLPEQANVRIEIVDVLGRQVMTVAPQTMSAGANKVITIDAARLSSGTYFYRVVAEGATRTFVQGSKFSLVK